MKHSNFGSLWAVGLLWIAPAQAQVSVNVGNGGVQVYANGTTVAVPRGNPNVYTSGNTNTSVQRSYQYQNGSGSVSTYQYQNNNGVSNSYQYQSGNGGQGNALIDMDLDDFNSTPAYLVLRASPGEVLSNNLRINGRSIQALNRSSLVLPLSGLLRSGTNRIELSGPSIAETEIVLAEDRPIFKDGRLYGSTQTLFQSSGSVNRTILLNIR